MSSKLKEYRESRGVKLISVAEYLGVTRHTYAVYERNPDMMSVGQARAACNFLGCDVEDIFLLREVN